MAYSRRYGWYFDDETNNYNGPYKSEAIALLTFKEYKRKLQ